VRYVKELSTIPYQFSVGKEGKRYANLHPKMSALTFCQITKVNMCNENISKAMRSLVLDDHLQASPKRLLLRLPFQFAEHTTSTGP
jgi:hypothetical protein